jgi:hypothetical protein
MHSIKPCFPIVCPASRNIALHLGCVLWAELQGVDDVLNGVLWLQLYHIR